MPMMTGVEDETDDGSYRFGPHGLWRDEDGNQGPPDAGIQQPLISGNSCKQFGHGRRC